MLIAIAKKIYKNNIKTGFDFVKILSAKYQNIN